MIRKGNQIEVGITNLDILSQVENEKTRKYDSAAKYKCKVKILTYVMIWEGLVTKYHKKHRNIIGITSKTEAYIQSLILKKEYFLRTKKRSLKMVTMKLKRL
jgi:hypothetical protein